MSDKEPVKAAAKPASAAKPPKKLVPRTAPKAELPAAAVASVAAAATPAEKIAEPAVAKPAEKPAAKPAKRVRKPSAVEQTVAKHRQVLAEALVEAQAINYDQPQIIRVPDAKPKKAAKAGKGDSAPKARKPKLVRDSYAMPEAEYARIGELKKRLAGLGVEIKKSELLRAGIMLLAAMNDGELTAVAGRVERIKTGRPAKK